MFFGFHTGSLEGRDCRGAFGLVRRADGLMPRRDGPITSVLWYSSCPDTARIPLALRLITDTIAKIRKKCPVRCSMSLEETSFSASYTRISLRGS